MRNSAWMACFILLATTPLGSAQDALDVRIHGDAMALIINPVSEVHAVNLTIEAPCLAPRQARTSLHLWVEERPEWAALKLEPDLFPLDVGECGGARATRTALLVIVLTSDAPAFEPASIVIAASLEGGVDNRTGRTHVDVLARYVQATSVTIPEAIHYLAPGEERDIAVRVQSVANAPTTVRFKIIGESGFRASAPQAIAFTQSGEQEVHVHVVAPHDGFRTDVVETLTVEITSERTGGSEITESTRITLLLSAEGFATPGAPSPLVLVVLALAAVALRRRT